jgi:hypothetical protein
MDENGKIIIPENKLSDGLVRYFGSTSHNTRVELHFPAIPPTYAA